MPWRPEMSVEKTRIEPSALLLATMPFRLRLPRIFALAAFSYACFLAAAFCCFRDDIGCPTLIPSPVLPRTTKTFPRDRRLNVVTLFPGLGDGARAHHSTPTSTLASQNYLVFFCF